MSTTDRTGCTAHQHGTRSAYNSHGCRCPDAREAHRLYRKRHRHGTHLSAHVPAGPARRRIQALQAIGYTRGQLAAELGYRNPESLQPVAWYRQVIRRELDANITRLYERLSMAPGPSHVTQRRARQAGYPAPLAWDDIDNDPAPAPTSENADREVDQIAVVRAINGHPPTKLRRPDRLAAIAELAADGIPSTEIADRLKVGVDRVRTDRNTMGNQRRRARREAGEAS